MNGEETRNPLGSAASATHSPGFDINAAKDYAEQFSVPIIHFVDGGADWMGSGVLVELFDRHFILTAGHCVRDTRNWDSVHVGISQTRHRFDVRFSRGHMTYRNEANQPFRDHGYFELDRASADWIASMNKIFMGAGRLSAAGTDISQELGGIAVLSGFPGSVANQTGQGVGSRFLACGVFLPDMMPCAEGGNPTPFDAGQSVDICVTDQMLRDNSGSWSLEDFPALEGASGGGFWLPEVANRDTELRLKLAGIRVGRVLVPPSVPGFIRFREVLVGHHLRLIADEHEDLRESIFEMWPGLANDAWV